MKHISGLFHPITLDALHIWLAERQKGHSAFFGVTALQFREFVEAEGVIQPEGGDLPRLVPIRLQLPDGREVSVTRDGFALASGELADDLWSVSAMVSELFCIRFRWDSRIPRMMVG